MQKVFKKDFDLDVSAQAPLGFKMAGDACSV